MPIRVGRFAIDDQAPYSDLYLWSLNRLSSERPSRLMGV
jgi:hypothetical protein